MNQFFDAVRAASGWPWTCSEEVSRRGECQPCERQAVALRLDPEESKPYPVCVRHTRAVMVPLEHIAAALRGDGKA